MHHDLIPSSRATLGDAERNSIYYVPLNPFVYKQADVPNHSFEQERLDLLGDRATTRMIVLDLSREMGLDYPATTPNMLARYAVIGSKDQLALSLNAVVGIYYVMTGYGSSECECRTVAWKAGDVFLFPGGKSVVHRAGEKGATLYLVTDEPMLSFAGTRAPSGGKSRIEAAYFSLEQINAHLAATHARATSGVEAAKAVWFVCRQMESLRTTSPNITANMNTLSAGDDQRPHRHSAAAITLAIQGDYVYSVVDGKRSDWSTFGVMVTPPSALHSHHNRGSQTMRSFVVQDSGLHYYSRTTGFRFDK